MNKRATKIVRDIQYYKFCSYGFLKNLRLFEPFLVLFFLSNELTFLQIGFLYTTREITRNVLEIPAGIIADSMGRRKTMIFSFGFYIISFTIFYLAGEYSYFLLAMILYALGDAFRTGTHKAMIFDYLKITGRSDQKAYYYGNTRSYSQLGSAISSLVGGIMVFYSGNYRDIFIYTSIPYFLDLILIASYPAKLDGLRKNYNRQHLLDKLKQVLKDFAKSFADMKIFRSVANLSLHTGFYRSFKDYLQPVLQALALSIPVLLFLDDHERTAVIVGVVYFFIYLMTSFSSRYSGSFSALFNGLYKPLNMTLIAGFISGILCGLFIHFQFLLIAVLFYVLIFLIENLRKPIGIANVADQSNKDILATTLSAESQFHSLLTALLAPVIGLVADQAGLGIAILVISFGLLLVSPMVTLKKQI